MSNCIDHFNQQRLSMYEPLYQLLQSSKTVYTWDTLTTSFKEDCLHMSHYINHLNQEKLFLCESLHQLLQSRKTVSVSMYTWAIASTTSINEDCLCMSHYIDYFNQEKPSMHEPLPEVAHLWPLHLLLQSRKTVYAWTITLTTSIKKDRLCMSHYQRLPTSGYYTNYFNQVRLSTHGTLHQPHHSRKTIYVWALTSATSIKKYCLLMRHHAHQPFQLGKTVFVWAITSTTMYFNQERLSMYVWAIISTTSIKKNCLCMSHYNNYFSQVRLSTHGTIHQPLHSRKAVSTWDITSNTSIKKDCLSMSH
jgi:hypothetical protein